MIRQFILFLSLLFVGIIVQWSATNAQTSAKPKMEKAVFAGGCFWCEETAFEGKPGVISVVSGYAGGKSANPTYEQVSAGGTGHAEVVEVTFDPSKTSYSNLLKIFWVNIDPTDAGGQFCDRGDQYRSEIFYIDESQKKPAEQSKKEIEKTKTFKEPIVTQITKLKAFYPAEEYHQDYYKKKPAHYNSYRTGCGRDRRLEQLWGPSADSTH